MNNEHRYIKDVQKYLIAKYSPFIVIGMLV